MKEKTNKVFFDIEGYEEDDGSTDNFGMAVTIDSEGNVKHWDRKDFDQFFEYLLQHDEIVSYAGHGYDNWVIAKKVGFEDA